MVFTIYCHTHRESGKRYVGQTMLSMHARWVHHRNRATKKTDRPCRYFHAAIATHGHDAFDHEVLETVATREEANAAEVKWIAHFGCLAPGGYNLQQGGQSHGHHPDTLARIGAITRARAASMTQEQRSAIAFAGSATLGPERRSARAIAREAAMTAEQKSARARASHAATSPEDKSARGRAGAAKANFGLTHEQLSERALARDAAMSPEQRSARSRAAYAGRRARAAEHAAKAA
jgi:hypothetical protein